MVSDHQGPLVGLASLGGVGRLVSVRVQIQITHRVAEESGENVADENESGRRQVQVLTEFCRVVEPTVAFLAAVAPPQQARSILTNTNNGLVFLL